MRQDSTRHIPVRKNRSYPTGVTGRKFQEHAVGMDAVVRGITNRWLKNTRVIATFVLMLVNHNPTTFCLRMTTKRQSNLSGGLRGLSDNKSDHLRSASQFIHSVREIQRDCKPLSGGAFLSEDTLELLRDTAKETASFMSSMNCGDAEQELEALLIRFEEMCRRRKMPIPPKIRPAVYELLAGELVANASLLGAPPKGIISFTVLRGAASALVDNQEFASFRDTPGIFRRAVMGKPNDPDGFLRGVIQKIDELPKREEFASLRDWPGILRQAAISYPSNPEAFLRGVIEKIDELLKQEEFASLRDSPGILRRAAVN